jgi:hypothetical protein
MLMKNGRNTAGQIAAGNTGRPKGSRNKATIAIESLLQGQAEALTQTAVTKALEGDSIALRLCMERIAPAPKDQPVSFSLPKMKNALDASEAAGSVLKAVSNGELTPIEATRAMGLIDSFRRTLELTEIEQRLQALEGNN